MPTGAGKTVVFSVIVHGASRKQRRTLIAVHRRELIRQASGKLQWAGVSHGIIAASFLPDPDHLVQVGSIQTLVRRLDTLPAFDLIVLDEAHHARAESWRALIKAQPQAKLLGVTATPARLDGKGLGIAAGGCFDDLVLGPSTAELIEQGWLAPVRCFVPAQRIDLSRVRVTAGDYVRDEAAAAVNTSAITADCVEQYRRRADHAAAIAFCCTVAHAEAVAEAFRDAGYRAAAVSGETPTDKRDALMAGLNDGSIEILTSCALIDEGLDVPNVGAVICLRPTKSLVLHRQQIGRGMRPAPGKQHLIVLDHVGNCITHGLPETEPKWTLAGVEKPAGEAPVWECPECGMVNPINRRICAECGCERPPPPPRPVPVAGAGNLAELTRAHLERVREMSWWELSSRIRTEAELKAYAAARGYRRGWVRHRLREQQEAAL
jgi:superfamily II DNA or RNA helicase